MKKNKLNIIAALLLCATIMLPSCIGSFKLSNNLLDWNKRVSRSKFLNELIFIVITPAYGVTSVVDALVLNSIEFWGGKNPVASNKTQKVEGENGEIYLVKRTKNGYKVIGENKSQVEFNFDEATQTWSIASEGENTKLFSFIDAENVEVYLPDGSAVSVGLDDAGIASLKATVGEYAPEFAYAR